jgi:hypothetical protein
VPNKQGDGRGAGELTSPITNDAILIPTTGHGSYFYKYGDLHGNGSGGKARGFGDGDDEYADGEGGGGSF